MPIDDGSYAQWAHGDYTAVDEGTVTPNDCRGTGADYIQEKISNKRASFKLDLSSIPDGYVIKSVDITVVDRGGGTGSSGSGGDDDSGGSYQTFARLNGVDTDSGVNLFAFNDTNACNPPVTQTINVADTTKSSATILEVGVVKTNVDDHTVTIGAISAVITYTKLDQTITVTTHAPASAIYGSSFGVSATSSSGLPVTITTTGVCSIDGNTITMTSGSGDCVVHYNQAGNESYGSAPEVTETTHATAKTVTATVTANDKTYDGNNTATISGCILTGVETGDVVTCSATSATFDNKNAGTGKTVTATGLALAGDDAAGYQLSSTTATATAKIDKLAVVVTAVTDTKTYDGTNASSGAPTHGTLATDDSATWSQTFADKNVGADKIITPSAVISDGNGGNNYDLTINTATGSITAKNLTISGLSAVSRAYNGTNAVALSGTPSLVGAIGGEDVVLAGTPVATFADKTVANTKPVTVVGFALSGADIGNYNLAQPTGLTADITPLALTGTITVDNKIYDGTTAATITAYNLSGGIIEGDDVDYIGGTANFIDRNVDNNKTVTAIGLSLSGADASNYTVNTTATTTANISQLSINVNAVTDSKIYDKTTSSAGIPVFAPALVGGDTPNFTQSFNDYNVGTGKTLTPSGTVNDGNGGANYVIHFSQDFTGIITARDIVVTAETKSKIYGAPDPALTYNVTSGSVLDGDEFSGSLARNPGEDVGVYAINRGSLALNDNYNITYNGADFTITTDAVLTVTADNKTKIYNTPDPVFTFTYSGFVGTDDTSKLTTLPSCSVTADHTNVGSYDISCNGGSSANYSFSYVGATLTVTQAEQAITFGTLTDKVYGDADFTVSASADSGLTVDFTTTGSCTVSGNTVHLTGAGTCAVTAHQAGNLNYKAATDVTQSFTVNKATATVVLSNLIQAYNGLPRSVTATTTPEGLTVDLTYDGLTTVPVNAGSYAVVGTVNDPNYVGTASDTLVISKVNLTVTGITANNKIYDGTTSATLNLGEPLLVGVMGEDDVHLDTTGAVGTFADKNVGADKTVAISGLALLGVTAGNYTLTQPTTTATITKREITVTAVTSSKIYDGNNTSSGLPTITSETGLASGDTATWTQTFATPEVGTEKTLIPAGTVNDGHEGQNYQITFVNNTTGVITAKESPKEEPVVTGGGSLGAPASSPCNSVEYYDWKSCVNGFQYRDIKMLVPEGCAITQAQRDAGQRACGGQVLGEKIVAEKAAGGICDDAPAIATGQVTSLLDLMNVQRNPLSEKNAQDKYIKKLLSLAKDKKITQQNINALVNYVAYSGPRSLYLGEGERAGVLHSYLAAFGRLPKTENEW